MIREINILTGVETSRALTAEEQAKADANTAEEIANAPAPYIAKRREEYPTIEECVHAILDDELDALQIKRNAVKDKYPKN